MHEYGCVPCVNPLYTTLFQEVPSTQSNKSMALTALFRRLPTLSQAPVRTRSGLAGGAGGTNLSCISSIGCDTWRKEAAGSHVALEQTLLRAQTGGGGNMLQPGQTGNRMLLTAGDNGCLAGRTSGLPGADMLCFSHRTTKTGATKARGDSHLQGQLLQPCHLAQWCQIQEWIVCTTIHLQHHLQRHCEHSRNGVANQPAACALVPAAPTPLQLITWRGKNQHASTRIPCTCKLLTVTRQDAAACKHVQE